MSRCSLCKKDFTAEELDNPDLTYVEVRSWVTGKKLQGPVLRERTGERAHTSCIKKLIDGEAPDQEPIPGLE